MDPLTFLCLASYEKGHDFLREAKRQGCAVFLITSLSLKDTAQWPRESIDDIFYMPDQDKTWNRNDTLLAISHLARTEAIDRVVALDDFDLEMAASLREHLRIPGMGETTTRYFRDKLAMRMQAMEAGLRVPEFVHLLNDEKVREFTERVPPPWVLKPRLMAGAIGIQVIALARRNCTSSDRALGDQRSFFLVERFVPGDVCHVDSIVYENQILFAVASQYGYPPLDVSHRGGIFTTRLLERGSADAQALLAAEPARAGGHGSAARRLAHRVHQGRRRRAVFPGNFGARGRRAYRGAGGSGHRSESVGRVGQDRNRRRQAALCAAAARERLRRRCWCRWPSRSIRTPRPMTIRRSCGACRCRITWG